MAGVRGVAVRVLVPVVAVAAAALAYFARNVEFETSLFAMLGDKAAAIGGDAGEKSSKTASVIFSSGDAAVASAAMEAFRKRIPVGCKEVPFAGGSLQGLVGKIGNRVSEEDLSLLRTKEGRGKIAKRAMRRRISSVMQPMFPLAEDPFFLKENFILSLAGSGCFVLPLELDADAVADIGRIADIEKSIRSAMAETARNFPDTLSISLTGVPFHTARAAERCRRETNALAAFSGVFIILLAFAVFRPVARSLYVPLALVASAGAGATALFALFGRVHAMTLVFGTSVLGLAADYSFHWLLGASGARSKTIRNLAVSLATTEVALLPLALSSLPVLREGAVFLAAALAAAFVFAVVFLPYSSAVPSKNGSAIRIPVACLVIASLAVAAALAAMRPNVGTSPKALYSPPSDLARADAILARMWREPTEEESALIASLYAEHGDIVSSLGTDAPIAPPKAEKGVSAALEEMLAAVTRETLVRLLASLALMAVILAAFFRRRAFAVFAPSIFALAVSAAVVAALGEDINLFHLLAGFLLAGMCVDYAVFLGSGDGAAFRPAFCSLLTSMAGFGALAFVSFPVARAFGVVLGAGLPAGFAAALALGGRVKNGDGVEKAASPLGMEILYLTYRLFGLGAMRFLSVSVAMVAWTFSPGVRKAVPSVRKLAMFARSLADKTVVMADGKRLPRVSPDGSSDAELFKSDVYSRKGVFVLSCHVGTIEVLSALASDPPRFHAWTDISRTAVFNAFYLRHSSGRKVSLHDISSIGVATAFEAGEWLDAGECLVMAGDRGDGAFRFAAAMGHPVYFAACVADGGGYVAIVRKLEGSAAAMKAAFDEIAGRLRRDYPNQNFEWS